MLFRVLVFVLLVAAGYYFSTRLRGNRISTILVSGLLVILVAAFFLLGKKLFAMFGFSVYLMIIVLGFAVGMLAGMKKNPSMVESKKLSPSGDAERDSRV